MPSFRVQANLQTEHCIHDIKSLEKETPPWCPQNWVSLSRTLQPSCHPGPGSRIPHCVPKTFRSFLCTSIPVTTSINISCCPALVPFYGEPFSPRLSSFPLLSDKGLDELCPSSLLKGTKMKLWWSAWSHPWRCQEAAGTGRISLWLTLGRPCTFSGFCWPVTWRLTSMFMHRYVIRLFHQMCANKGWPQLKRKVDSQAWITQ